MIEKLKQVDRGFEDPSGCFWESPDAYLFTGVLPSCCCGDPASIGRYVRDMLRKHVKQTGTDAPDVWPDNKYEDLPTMFFLSWADDKGYIEHGTTIRCSWMTSEGDELLRDLDIILGKD